MWPGAHRDAAQQAPGPRRDRIYLPVVAAAQPQHAPVRRYAAHVRRAAAAQAPLRDRAAGTEREDRDRALVAVGHVEVAGVAARIQAVGAAARRLEPDLPHRA